MMRIQILGYLFAIAVLVFSGCDGPEATQGDTAPQGDPSTKLSGGETAWDVIGVSGQPYLEKIELPGASVHGFETTQLMAKVGGYVGEIKKVGDEEIDIGSMVLKDQPLVVLDVPEMADELKQKGALVAQANSEVLQAEAAVKQALAEVDRRRAEVQEASALREEKTALLKLRETTYKRIAVLVKDGSLGKDNLDEAKFALDASASALVSVDASVRTTKAHVESALANVSKANADKASADSRVKVAEAALSRAHTMERYATIRAPFDGMITRRMVDHGAFVRPATSNSGSMPLFEITRTDKVRVLVSVPSQKAAQIVIGQKVVFHSIGGLPGITLAGTVTRSATALEQKSRMMRIEVDFQNPLKHSETGKMILLKPGMFGTVRVVVQDWESLSVVPTSAVARDETGQWYMMAVDSGGVCRRQPVEIVFNDAKNVGIRGGVKTGESVVLQNITELKDGQTISVKSP